MYYVSVIADSSLRKILDSTVLTVSCIIRTVQTYFITAKYYICDADPVSLLPPKILDAVTLSPLVAR
jgi:hypothetical protein